MRTPWPAVQRPTSDLPRTCVSAPLRILQPGVVVSRHQPVHQQGTEPAPFELAPRTGTKDTAGMQYAILPTRASIRPYPREARGVESVAGVFVSCTLSLKHLTTITHHTHHDRAWGPGNTFSFSSLGFLFRHLSRSRPLPSRYLSVPISAYQCPSVPISAHQCLSLPIAAYR